MIYNKLYTIYIYILYNQDFYEFPFVDNLKTTLYTLEYLCIIIADHRHFQIYLSRNGYKQMNIFDMDICNEKNII